MEGGQIAKKNLKVDVSSEHDGTIESQVTSATGQGTPGLTRQPSVTKGNCLCSPTTHAGSFRCRLHRAPSLQRAKSIDTAANQDAASKD
ncbi:hypothetical protein SLE2022_203590 [Rubroshorea leprosula]